MFAWRIFGAVLMLNVLLMEISCESEVEADGDFIEDPYIPIFQHPGLLRKRRYSDPYQPNEPTMLGKIFFDKIKKVAKLVDKKTKLFSKFSGPSNYLSVEEDPFEGGFYPWATPSKSYSYIKESPVHYPVKTSIPQKETYRVTHKSSQPTYTSSAQSYSAGHSPSSSSKSYLASSKPIYSSSSHSYSSSSLPSSSSQSYPSSIPSSSKSYSSSSPSSVQSYSSSLPSGSQSYSSTISSGSQSSISSTASSSQTYSSSSSPSSISSSSQSDSLSSSPSSTDISSPSINKQSKSQNRSKAAPLLTTSSTLYENIEESDPESTIESETEPKPETEPEPEPDVDHESKSEDNKFVPKPFKIDTTAPLFPKELSRLHYYGDSLRIEDNHGAKVEDMIKQIYNRKQMEEHEKEDNDENIFNGQKILTMSEKEFEELYQADLDEDNYSTNDDTENGSFEKVLDEVYNARKEDSDKNKHIETVLKDVESLMKVASSSSIPTDTINEALQTITHDVEDELVQNTASDQQAKTMKVISNIDSVLKARQSSLITENEYKDAMKIIKEDLGLLQSTEGPTSSKQNFNIHVLPINEPPKKPTLSGVHSTLFGRKESLNPKLQQVSHSFGNEKNPLDNINETHEGIANDIGEEIITNEAARSYFQEGISNIETTPGSSLFKEPESRGIANDIGEAIFTNEATRAYLQEGISKLKTSPRSGLHDSPDDVGELAYLVTDKNDPSKQFLVPASLLETLPYSS